MARQGQKSGASDSTTDQLEQIKRLLILQLVASGVQAKHIAKALGVDNSVVSRMVPVRAVTRDMRSKQANRNG